MSLRSPVNRNVISVLHVARYCIYIQQEILVWKKYWAVVLMIGVRYCLGWKKTDLAYTIITSIYFNKDNFLNIMNSTAGLVTSYQRSCKTSINRPVDGVVGYHVSLTFDVRTRSWVQSSVWSSLFTFFFSLGQLMCYFLADSDFLR
jgi:hypothetical protein